MVSDRLPPTLTEAESETLDLRDERRTFNAGQVVGDRYQILALLGRGGMGEVWHAFDLKLRVEVALKALRSDIFKNERRRESLRQEVRSARDVVSPNVCRLYDLHELEGLELVSMEYVDGQTLLEVMRERAPFDLQEAQDLASQFLAGLDAIHAIGLVHRDIKPENIMLTRAGRVVVMDFGIARQEAEGSGTVSGTAAYMAPEQAAGQAVDARADIYSAGIVLAEMVNPTGLKDRESRESVWEAVRAEPITIPDSPWTAVITKAVAKDRDLRFDSANELSRALEEVTLRVVGADDLHPYPGLAPFTEKDAEYFFGREAEVEQMWRTLEGPPRLLGLVGPSGAGKTSFLRAGLLPSATSTWVVVRCKPGTSPFVSLGQALAPEMASDAEAMHLFPRVQEPGTAVQLVRRWSRSAPNSVLIVDQFEELFTLNAEEVQDRFSGFLSRLPLEANVFVLLSMRDDFLMLCHQIERLRPIVHGLTLLDPPAGANLRRALVHPANKCGYRFECDELVEDMLAEVEGERGALPLLAFAAARLWEKRDRETGLLTRVAYNDIGGVAGALARHAEATIDRIGTSHIPIVREIFRNLVTAGGTRAVREWDELLSIFSNSHGESPEEVLRQLIDARLLTSYEIREEDKASTRMVEIIHESLLANWPRLVRWKTQDQDGAQIRDELRQAARSWDEHDRQNDRLWTGTAFREYQLWRERYPGGLTELEEEFARAMTAHARRRSRRRRTAVAALIVLLLGGLAVVGSFWRQAEHAARRAAAAELIALGQLGLEGYPTASVAHAIASLELFDSPAARMLALEALWKGPTAIIINDEWTLQTVFTSDGNWLIQSRSATGTTPLRVIGADGSSTVLEHTQGGHAAYEEAGVESGYFGLVGWDKDNTQDVLSLWSAPEKWLLAKARYDGKGSWRGVSIRSADRRLLIVTLGEDDRLAVDSLGFDGDHTRLGTIDLDLEADQDTWLVRMNNTGRQIAASTGQDIYSIEIGDHGPSKPRFLGRQGTPLRKIDMDERGRFVATADENCRIRLWYLDGSTAPAVIQGPTEGCSLHTPSDAGDYLVSSGRTNSTSDREYWVWSLESREPRFLRRFDIGGRGMTGYWLSENYWVRSGPEQQVRLWPIGAPPDAEPISLRRGEVGRFGYARFHPNEKWLVVPDESGLSVWPLARPYPTVFRAHTGHVNGLVFGPEGRWLASSSNDGTVRIWPLVGETPRPGWTALDSSVRREMMLGLARSPDGKLLFVGNSRDGAHLLNLDDDTSTTLSDAPASRMGDDTRPYGETAFSMDGRYVAAASDDLEDALRKIGVWDVATGEQINVLAEGEVNGWGTPRFTEDGRLMALGRSGLRLWDVKTGESELVFGGVFQRYATSQDRRRLILLEASTHVDPGRAIFVDLENGVVTPLETHGHRIQSVSLNPAGTLAITGDRDGIVRVGPVTGEEPRILLGHENSVDQITVDPTGRWVASGGKDHSVRLWAMPDLSKPPLHTLPREALIAKLKTLTNLRVVRDDDSSSGWTLTHDPFPGWESVPTW